MTAKTYLQQIYVINERIKRLMQYRERLRQDMYSLKSPSLDSDRVQTSASGDGMLRMIARVAEAERDVVSEINRLLTTRENVIARIDRISYLHDIKVEDRERYKTMLFQYHVLMWTWTDIAQGIGYTERQIHRLKYKAWDAFAKANEDVCKCQ